MIVKAGKFLELQATENALYNFFAQGGDTPEMSTFRLHKSLNDVAFRDWVTVQMSLELKERNENLGYLNYPIPTLERLWLLGSSLETVDFSESVALGYSWSIDYIKFSENWGIRGITAFLQNRKLSSPVSLSCVVSENSMFPVWFKLNGEKLPETEDCWREQKTVATVAYELLKLLAYFNTEDDLLYQEPQM